MKNIIKKSFLLLMLTSGGVLLPSAAGGGAAAASREVNIDKIEKAKKCAQRYVQFGRYDKLKRVLERYHELASCQEASSWLCITVSNFYLNDEEIILIVELLLEHGAGSFIDAKLAKFYNHTILHSVAHNYFISENNKLKILQLLKKYFKSDSLRQQDALGNTPLHYAYIKNQQKVIELLLEYGADDSIKNEKGRKPSDIKPPVINFGEKSRSSRDKKSSKSRSARSESVGGGGSASLEADASNSPSAGDEIADTILRNDAKTIFGAMVILGLASGFTEKDCSSAYHRLALVYHPDKNKNNLDEPMCTAVSQKINAAYALLSNK